MASKEQKQMMQEFFNHTGWEFMGQERVKASDRRAFIELWDANVEYLQNRLNEVDSIINEYRNNTP